MSERVKSLPEKELSGAQRFLLRTAPGRVLLRLLVRPWVSRLAGRYLSGRVSSVHVKGFIRSNEIDMSDYPETRYRSFNDFFTRRVKEGARPTDGDPDALTAPCDSRLSVYEITPESRFVIKGGEYSVESLLKDERLAERLAGGLCLIFRLCVDNYHRYCWFDDGEMIENRAIPGVLHTVHPAALEVCNIYKENAREVTVMETAHFGTAVQVEVGAMMVGRIKNLPCEGGFTRGQEKGYFEFGGSTCVLLLEKGAASVDEELLENTREGMETRVRLGERIGRAAR